MNEIFCIRGETSDYRQRKGMEGNIRRDMDMSDGEKTRNEGGKKTAVKVGRRRK